MAEIETSGRTQIDDIAARVVAAGLANWAWGRKGATSY